jgi:hypothetical protein
MVALKSLQFFGEAIKSTKKMMVILFVALDQIEAQTALGISGAADNLPRVQEVFEKIRTQPNILTYVTNRPQTQI